MLRRDVRSGLLLAAVALACAAPRVSAWGPNGHRAVSRIAERHLTPEAARAVRELLAPEALAYVGTWADEIGSEEQWAKADSWHWVTIPDGQTYATAERDGGVGPRGR